MSTYAVYRIWCGILKHEWVHSPDMMIGPKMDEMTDRAYDGLLFEDQHMNGKRVGFGVTVSELDWCVDDEDIAKEGVYDPSENTKAIEILARVKQVFQDRRIKIEPKLYHLLDLGG